MVYNRHICYPHYGDIVRKRGWFGIIKANFHTHTTFCDGANTPEEMVQSAIALGMTALGFSGHAYIGLKGTTGMEPEAEKAYRAEVLRLKEAYSGVLPIYLGIEMDGYSPPAEESYEFSIGSVHGMYVGGEYRAVDYREDYAAETVEKFFGGDWYACAEAYYQAEAELANRHDPDFFGHFDLVTKFNEGGKYFDESHPRYRKVALETLHYLLELEKPFEVNTGAISRGYRVTPYPAPFLLEEIRKEGGRIILSSDCHGKDGLLCAFPEATELAKSCGFRTALVLTPDGFREENL